MAFGDSANLCRCLLGKPGVELGLRLSGLLPPAAFQRSSIRRCVRIVDHAGVQISVLRITLTVATSVVTLAVSIEKPIVAATMRSVYFVHRSKKFSGSKDGTLITKMEPTWWPYQ